MREHRVLERLQREIERALQGLNERDQAWLLAHIRAWCWRKMLLLDEHARWKAELEATSPLQMIHIPLEEE